MPTPAQSAPRSDAEALTKVARTLIGRVPWFLDCTPALLDQLIALGRIREFQAKECVCVMGQSAAHMHFLVRGSLETIRIRRNGHRQLIGLLFPGDIVGLIPCIDGLGHINDIYARSKSAILMLRQEDINALRQSNGGLGQAIEMYLAFRCRLLYERLTQDASIPIEARLASLLQLMTSLYGLPQGKGFVLDMKITQVDLADWLGVSRESINSAIRLLESRGIVSLGYSTITVLDNAMLKQLVAEAY